jgi:cold shock CspA family protein
MRVAAYAVRVGALAVALGIGAATGGAGVASAGTYTGIVSFYSSTKGFGFIKGFDGADYFLHSSGVPTGSVPKAGDKVDFSFQRDVGAVIDSYLDPLDPRDGGSVVAGPAATSRAATSTGGKATTPTGGKATTPTGGKAAIAKPGSTRTAR